MSSQLKVPRFELIGISASDGIATGPIWMPNNRSNLSYMPRGEVRGEAIALQQAIDAALGEVEDLVFSATGPAVDILKFHHAILADDTFYRGALAEISAGQNAVKAWNKVLTAEIISYQNASDETFRARAFDLQDIQTRVTRILCNQSAEIIPTGVIVVAENFNPTDFIMHDWKNGAIALTNGSQSSHLAVLARQFGVPMVINLQKRHHQIQSGQEALLISDGKAGKLIVAPTAGEQIMALRAPLAAHTAGNHRHNGSTADGKPISLMINLAHLRELDQLDVSVVDGIGLVRTEFLFAAQYYETATVSEDVQFQTYRRILNWARGKPVYIRTLDAGGDKPVAGLASRGKFSDLRGIRVSLSKPEIFRVQIRALLRAARFGNLHVTLPMVGIESDLSDALVLFDDEAAKLSAADIAYAVPPIGIMVEVPAVAMTLEHFSRAAHFAIGTNDLIQYTLGEPRDAAGVKSGVENPAIMSLIEKIVSVGQSLNKPVSVCGDAASNAMSVRQLLSVGITCFSVSLPSLPLVVAAIRNFNTMQDA